MSKAEIIKNGIKKTVEFVPPRYLSDLIRDSGTAFSMPCGGKGACRKCAVHVCGEITPTDEKREDDVRLACRTKAVGNVTIRIDENMVYSESENGFKKLTLKPFGKKFGVAVDIGTTTIASNLFDLKSGKLCAFGMQMNSQLSYGADVISRIDYAINGRKDELKKCIAEDINSQINLLAEKAGISKEDIDAVSISGNTVMLYLLIGKDTELLASFPFKADELFGKYMYSEDLSLELKKGAKVYLSKCIGAYVGGDITSGLVSTEIADDFSESKKTVKLFVDVGTNGEIVLYNRGKISCCSTAVGPAFEGACIYSGMSAVGGAIDRIWIEKNKTEFTVIGNTKPVGICGSGIIDAVSVMLEAGIIDENGTIREEGHNFEDNLEYTDNVLSLKICDGVYITQEDIHAVLLAKSAVFSGIKAIMNYNDIQVGDVERLIVSGGFGKHIDYSSAERIGLFPRGLKDRIIYAGNSSLSGAGMILLSSDYALVAEKIADDAKIFTLSNDEYFNHEFINNMKF